MRAASGKAALDTLQQLKTRQEPVALLLSDQRMPGMTGVEFLEQAQEFYPHAKRVLLTAYADTEAAIQAINTARIHYYLNKPWDPPEEKLYPVLTDLLDDWKADYRPPFEGIRVIGNRWALSDHQLRNFLSRNHVPYRWMDAASNDEAQKLLDERQLKTDQLPVVLFADGSLLADANPDAVAAKVGLSTHATQEFYDMVVVGAGPAGLAAAVYGASEGLKTLVIEPEAPGGQAGSSSKIENYLGFPAGISGAELTSRAVSQARKFGARPATPYRAVGLEPGEDRHVVHLDEGQEIHARAVLLATGAEYRRLPLADLSEYEGSSIFYAAGPPEAQLCGASRVAVVGGGNSAGQAAVWLARGGALVTLLHRRADLRETMSDYLIREVERAGVVIRDRSEIAELHGRDGRLEAVTLTDGTRLPFGFVFLFLGAKPCTEWLGDAVARHTDGFLLTGEAAGASYLLETSIPGIFAAGDVRSGSTKRCATAVGEGSMAVQFVHQHLSAQPVGVR
jgi:thioredoxin reductase (NADPH)